MHPLHGWIRFFMMALAAVALFAPLGTAEALTEPDTATAPLPDYDIRSAGGAALPRMVRTATVAPAQETALQAVRSRFGDVRVRLSPLTGTPNRIQGRGTPLTAASLDPPAVIARNFLLANLDLLALGQEDLATATFSREYQTKASGVTHLTLQQKIGGIPLFGAQVNINIDRSGQVLGMAGELLPNLDTIANTSTPLITEQQTILAAVQNARLAGVRGTPTPVLVYFPLSPSEARLAWDILIEDTATPNRYRILVDAQDGRILWRQSMTFYLDPHGEVYTRESPIPNIPIGAASGEVPREDIGFNGGLFFAFGDPHYDWWNDSTGNSDPTSTKSNSTHAKEDTDGDNDDTEGFPPSVGDGNFTFPIDLTQTPGTYLSSSTVNLFHWLNRLHDIFYGYGFDEAAGNYQSDNYGLGGLGGDPLQGDTQDPKENCNAHTGWSSAGDGVSTRIQTGICGNNDLGLENQAITHEWGHAVHARLVPLLGGAQQMGEGWCDFFAIAVFAEPTDELFGSYPIASWSFSKPLGIRRQPYSVDQSIFTRTYADINESTFCSRKTCSNDASQLCDKDEDCGAGNTCGRTYCSFPSECEPPVTTVSQGPCIPSVYHAGELWTESLWLARANLVWKHGFATGNQRAMQLVIDGMKLSPPNPDFLDTRDAILLADTTRYAGADTCLLWDGFARMGLGSSASTTGPEDINPVEAFDLPPACTPDIQTITNLTFANICPGQTPAQPLSVANAGNGELIVRSVTRASGSNEFTVGPLPPTPAIISAGTQTDFSVQYAPTACSSGSAVVRMVSNDPDQPQLDLTYTGSTDAVPPTISFCPANLTLECDQPTDPAHTGTATAVDACGAPTVTFTDDVVANATCAAQKVITRSWQATDVCGNSSGCQQVITVQDTTAPVISCNAPAVITPPDAPVPFTATATDNCDAQPEVAVTGYDCFKIAKNGKIIDKKESCNVSFTGATVTILDSGGVGDIITWKVEASDCAGNVAQQLCSLTVVNPAK